MSEKIWKEIEISILKQIYACKGGIMLKIRLINQRFLSNRTIGITD